MREERSLRSPIFRSISAFSCASVAGALGASAAVTAGTNTGMPGTATLGASTLRTPALRTPAPRRRAVSTRTRTLRTADANLARRSRRQLRDTAAARCDFMNDASVYASPFILEQSLPVGAVQRRAEDLFELVRRRDFELIVPAVARPLVRPPSDKYGRVAKAPSLEVVVLHFADPLDPQGFPRKILARAPAALASWHARELAGASPRPVAPRVILEGALSQRGKLQGQLLARRHRECRCHSHVLQRPSFVVEPEQQGAHRVVAGLVPPEAGHHAIGCARVLHLEHRTLARLVRPVR